MEGVRHTVSILMVVPAVLCWLRRRFGRPSARPHSRSPLATKKVMECFLAWLKFGQFQPAELVELKMTFACFSFLEDPNLSEIATDVRCSDASFFCYWKSCAAA